jgi:hypothetical protein
VWHKIKLYDHKINIIAKNNGILAIPLVKAKLKKGNDITHGVPYEEIFIKNIED